MNGYKLMADTDRKLVSEGKIKKEVAEKEIRIYDFLAECDLEDLCIMVDSTAFNDLIKGFCKRAVTNAGLDKKAKEKVLEQLRWVFDELTAREIFNNYC